MALLDRTEVADLSGVVISHVHPDHSMDVLALFHVLAYGPGIGRRLPLWAPESVLERVARFLSPEGPSKVDDVFEPIPVGKGSEVTAGEMVVSFAAADHSVPAVVARYEAGGRSLVFTGDTGPAGDWRHLVKGADLFLCEASYQGEPGSHAYTQHLTATEAGQIARESGASKLILTHIRPDLDPSVSVAEAEAAFDRPVVLAVPGTSHDV